MSAKRERDDGSDSGGDELLGLDEGPREGKRKVNRACDSCRKKKHRCDGDTTEATCSTCKALGLACTYLQSSTRKATPKGYVDALEARIATLMSIVAQDRPGVDLERLLGGPLVLDPSSFNVRRPAGQSKPKRSPDLPGQSSHARQSSPRQDGPVASGSSSTRPASSSAYLASSTAGPSSRPTDTIRHPPQSAARDEPEPIRDKGDSEDELIRKFVRLDKPDEVFFRSFLGKSSNLPLMRSAIVFKYGVNANRFSEECALHPLAMELSFRTPSWEHPPESSFSSMASVFESWPDDALASSLIELYFIHANETLPLLQKAHFLRLYATQLYFRDDGFARICLLVFAIGSGYSNDLRVRAINEDGDYEPVTSAGWNYYHAFQRIARSPLNLPALADLQLAVLHASFLQVHGARATRAWPVIGVGLKVAVELGAHRRGATRSKDAHDNELMRRAFWCLYLMDVDHSSALGRPLCLGEDELDVEVEFDDTFWQDGLEMQPHGQPSAVQSFCLEIQLARILARTLNLLFAIKRPQKSSLVIVNDLDEQLKDWLATVPAYLRWDPSRPDSLDFRLSAHVQMAYQKTITYVHRPFLPSPQHPVSASPSSITAAFKASVASIAVYNELYKKTQQLTHSAFFVPQNAGTILLLCVWAGPATHEFADPAEAMEAVDTAVWHTQNTAKRFLGLGDALVPNSVLAAPRIDYLVESVAKRQERERKVAHVTELQRRHRMEATERSSRSPAGGPSPSSMFPSSSSSSPYPPTGSNGSPSNSTPAYPTDSFAAPFDIMDLFQLGGDFMFPDLPSDHDPAMTLFLSETQQTPSMSMAAPFPPSHIHPNAQPYQYAPYPASSAPSYFGSGGGGSAWNTGGMPGGGRGGGGGGGPR